MKTSGSCSSFRCESCLSSGNVSYSDQSQCVDCGDSTSGIDSGECVCPEVVVEKDSAGNKLSSKQCADCPDGQVVIEVSQSVAGVYYTADLLRCQACPDNPHGHEPHWLHCLVHLRFGLLQSRTELCWCPDVCTDISCRRVHRQGASGVPSVLFVGFPRLFPPPSAITSFGPLHAASTTQASRTRRPVRLLPTFACCSCTIHRRLYAQPSSPY